MRNLILSALLAAFLAPLSGSTLQKLSLKDMIQQSTAIVYGTIQPGQPAFRGPIIYTHYQLQIIKSYKGASLLRYMDVAVPGGVVSGFRQAFAGAPALVAGQKYVLFLWTSKSGLTQIIGLSQGLFNVAGNTSGQLIVSRGATTETMLNSTGQVVNDSNIKMTMAQMVGRIQTVLGSSGQ
jgi:hypothetical protein